MFKSNKKSEEARKSFLRGVETFAKEGTTRHATTLKAYNDGIAGAKPDYEAGNEALRAGIYRRPALANAEAKLITARKAAGYHNPTTTVQSSTRTAATTVFATTETENEHKSGFRQMMERRAAKKHHASMQLIDGKIRKGPLIGWTLAGFFGAAVALWIAYALAFFVSHDTESPWVLWWAIVPASIIFFAAFGFRKAIRPKDTFDGTKEEVVTVSEHHTA